MQENLLGYLFKSLDPDTHREVEAYLRDHPEAAARLERLDNALKPLAADAEGPEPPPGLVLGTLARIAEHKCRRLPPAPPPSRSQAGTPGRRRFRRADVLVAALLLIVVGGLIAPGLLHQWRAYQRRACEHNLANFWHALAVYSDEHEGDFPRVEERGPRSFAGVFVPLLQDAGVLREVSVVCPAQGYRPPPRLGVRELEDLYRTSPQEFETAIRDLSGTYSYSLGFREGNSHSGLYRGLGDQSPILADRSPLANSSNSPNHGGAGQNVLYIGGQVRWCTVRGVGPEGDDIYLNRQYQILAGVDHNDSVLAPSAATPYPPEGGEK